jgi:hypothetical protein
LSETEQLLMDMEIKDYNNPINYFDQYLTELSKVDSIWTVVILNNQSMFLSWELPAHVCFGQLRCSKTPMYVRPVTPMYVPRPPLYLDHVDLTCSVSLSNVFVSNTHSYPYVAFSITTLFSTLCSGSCLLCNSSILLQSLISLIS